jgi:hypothetical protein
MIPEESKQLFINKYATIGNEKFFRFLIAYAENRIANDKQARKTKGYLSPEVELLDYHDKFMFLYRKDCEQDLLNIAKIFRRAAHSTYRMLLKAKLTRKNYKFLNLV